jgi:hypothetical protein
MWGNFITKGDPRISVELAKGTSGNASTESSNAANDWPMFKGEHPVLLDANITGGTPITVSPFGGINVTELVQPRLSNDFRLANAFDWEAGRGRRCEFLRSMAMKIPE